MHLYFDVYASRFGEFVLTAANVNSVYVADLTGIYLLDFESDVNEFGFVEFEFYRDICAIVVPHNHAIPANARA